MERESYRYKITAEGCYMMPLTMIASGGNHFSRVTIFFFFVFIIFSDGFNITFYINETLKIFPFAKIMVLIEAC